MVQWAAVLLAQVFHLLSGRIPNLSADGYKYDDVHRIHAHQHLGAPAGSRRHGRWEICVPNKLYIMVGRGSRFCGLSHPAVLRSNPTQSDQIRFNPAQSG